MNRTNKHVHSENIMGVRGLSQFLRKSGLLRPQSLRDTRIVVDAQNVLFKLLYKAVPDEQASNGGDYPDIAIAVRKMLNKLSLCGLSPIFVFDGISSTNEAAWEQVRQRNREKLDNLRTNHTSCAGILAVPVAVKVLREFGAEVMQADVSADRTIAQLGNELNCPILSGDGDFLLYDTRGGVALLGDREVACLLNEETAELIIPMWNYTEFINTNNLRTPDLALFAATVTYMFAWNEYRDFGRIIRSVRTQDAERLFSTFRKEGLTIEKFRDSVRDFTIDNATVYRYLSSDTCNLKTFAGLDLPVDYQRLWRGKNFPVYLCNVLVSRRVNMLTVAEDISQPCVFDMSSPIRQVSYGIISKYDLDITKQPVKIPVEYIRQGERFVDKPLKPLFRLSYGQLPNLAEVSGLQVEERRRILLTVLQVRVDKTDVPDDVRFVLAAIRFWKLQDVGIEYIRAMLICIIKYRFIETSSGFNFRAGYIENIRIEPRKNNLLAEEKLRIMHPFTMFSAIFLDAVQLNSLLQEPFRGVSAEFYFRGSLLLDLVLEMRENPGIAEAWFCNQNGNQLYHLYRQMETRII